MAAGGVPIPPLLSGQPPLAILVDYDGTVALTDVGDTIMKSFLPPDVWEELEAAYETGRIGSREIMAREIALLPEDPAQVIATASAQPHDPAFPGFVRRAHAAGIPVEIVSDGFGFFIEPAVRRLGIADDLAIVTSRTTFEGGARIEFPNGHPTCFVCGTCKRTRVLAHQAAGRAVVFIGDGESDRYAAGYADFVFAKDSLIRICEGYDWPFARWQSFEGLDAWLASEIAAIAAGRPTVTSRERDFICGPELWGPGLLAPPRPFAVRGRDMAPGDLAVEPGAKGRSPA
ncbi:MAG TPA: HAD-IB family phosphatase [Candidatus Saccharimonadales bacterium]|nr:HAD-IB family phosphatase [Candidatus Saccharimonadales bacterium]